MFELASGTPPISPESELLVPQLYSGRAAKVTGEEVAMGVGSGGGFDEPGWADLYNMMSDLPDVKPTPAELWGAEIKNEPELPAFGTDSVVEDSARFDIAQGISRMTPRHASGSPGVVPNDATLTAMCVQPRPTLTIDTSNVASELTTSSGRSRPVSARIKARKFNAAGKRSRRSPTFKREMSPASPVLVPPRRTTRPFNGSSAQSAPRAVSLASRLLPDGHKPARGRGRQLQLASMTEEQKKAEAKARLEKNRQAAREFRTRRKEHVIELEQRVADFEARDFQQTTEIERLNGMVAKLQQQLAFVQRHGVRR